MWQDSLKPALWRWMVGTLIALGYAVLISSCTPDEVTIRPSHIAAETAEESDAAEKMPIAHGIYPDLPFEPTEEDFELGLAR